MAAENIVRERLGHSPPPAAEGENLTHRSSDNLPISPPVNVEEPDLPSGGSAQTPNTPATAVVFSPVGETTAAPGFVTNSVAPSEQADGANLNCAQRLKTSENPTTMVLMRVKEELAIVKSGRDSDDQATKIGFEKS